MGEDQAEKVETIAPHPILFDDFVPGALLGTSDIHIDRQLITSWLPFATAAKQAEALPDALCLPLPPEFLTAMTMRGYMLAVNDRPVGNIHARLSIDFLGECRLGDVLEIEVICLTKALHKGRRWLKLGVSGSVAASPVVSAAITTIWAQ